MVKSISWPTALTTGSLEPAIARATFSSLNAHRSSSDPPPRQRTMTLAGRVLLIFKGIDNFGGGLIPLDGNGKDSHLHEGLRLGQSG